MGPKTRAAIWVALSIALFAAPILVLGLVRMKPLWLNVTLVVVLCVPGIFAIMAAWKHYYQR